MIHPLVARVALISALIVAAVIPQFIPRSSVHAENTVSVDGPTAVVSNTFEQAGGLGYDTFVVFWVKNTDPARAAVNVPFRVTLFAGPTLISTSDGSDTVTIWPNETRLVSYQVLDSPVGIQPDNATVQVYPTSSMMRPTPPVSQDNWVIGNVQFQCQGVVIECNAIGDLTWTGSGQKRPVQLSAAVFQDNYDGPIVAAGVSPINVGLLDSGQSAPFRVSLRGFDQPAAGRPPQLPDGMFVLKMYVESPP